MIYQSMTDTGRVRTQNQDNFANYTTKEYSLFVVADGMGGHKGGKVASKIAVDSIRNFVIENYGLISPKSLLLQAVEFANQEIYQKANQDKDLYNMGTTAEVLLIIDDKAFIAHIGDSRIYHHFEGKLHQITKDDSYVQELIDTGIKNINPKEIESYKNIVTRALGVEKKPEVSLINLEVNKGESFILCSDGLTNMIEDYEIEEVINLDLDLKESVEILVYMANSSGGHDNITITLVRI